MIASKTASATMKSKRSSRKVVLLPYKNGSKSCAALAQKLADQLKSPVTQLRTEGSKFKPTPGIVVVNWGNSHNQSWDHGGVTILNHPNVVRLATNKLRTFQRFRENGFDAIPEWTTVKDEAEKWLAEGGAVVARTILDGHSGAGIVLCDTVEQIPNAPLYTRYVKKQKEFRVHVAFGNIIDVQEKRRRNEVGKEADSRIRNHHTGWVYCRDAITEPGSLRSTAVQAIAAIGLDFGAVDIIWNQKKDLCLVLEVNTACGLEGTTLDTYTNLLLEKVNAAHI